MIKKIRRYILFSLVFTVVFTFLGCYDIRELDKISIVTGVAIDKSDLPGSMELTVQITKANAAAPSGGGKGGGGGGGVQEKPAMLMNSVKPDVLEAFEILRHDNSRTLFLHHNQVLIFGKSEAESGVLHHLDYFMRSHETRMEVMVLMAEGSGKDVLNTSMELEKVTSIGIRRMIMNKTQIADSLGVNMLEFVSKLTDRITAPVLPIIRIVKEADKTRLSLTGMAVFKQDKLVGELTEDQAMGYTWVAGDVKSGSVSVKAEQGSSELYIKSASSKIKSVFGSDGKPSMQVDVEARFNMGEITGFEGMAYDKIFNILTKGAQESIKNQIMSSYRTVQMLNADIYGFGSYISQHHPRKWKALKSQWDRLFPAMELKLNIKADIYDTGITSKSPEMEIKR